MIEGNAAQENLELLRQIKAGTTKFTKPQASALQKRYAASTDIAIAPIDRYAAREFQGYEGKTIAILAISGPLMKEDYCGWYGTASLRNEFLKISTTESIKTIVLLFDTPGGMVDGLEPFANAIQGSEKETLALIQGHCCSGGYWLAASCDKIIATAKTDIIGSIGSMFSMQFYSDEALEKAGIVVREYYADASKEKNKMFREAKAGKGRMLIEQMLNPMNDIFITHVKEQRGEKLNADEVLAGNTYLAEKSKEHGLIDEIGSLETVINNHYKKNKTTSITMSKWTALLALVGLSATAKKEDLTEAHLDTVDASINDLNVIKAERDGLNTKVSELNTKVSALEAAAATAATEKDALQAQVTALTTKRDELQAEVTRLGALDGGKITEASGDGDKFDGEGVDAATMDFQKALNDKI